MLLKWGTAEADRLALPCYLEASEEGKPLYVKHGWQEVGRLEVDLSKWGGPTNVVAPFMLRPAATEP